MYLILSRRKYTYEGNIITILPAHYSSICDVIKQNESELANNIDSSIQQKIVFNFFCNIIVLSSTKMAITLDHSSILPRLFFFLLVQTHMFRQCLIYRDVVW